MRFVGFVLSGIYKDTALIGAVAFFVGFVLPLAPLALRNFRCIGHPALAHNKSKQYAPGGAGRAKARRCLNR